MKPILTFLISCLIISQLSFAQESAVFTCAHLKKAGAAKVTVADAAEEYYDVKYLKFNLALSNESIYISGDVTTRAQVLIPSFSLYVFELDSALVIEKILVDGVPMPFTNHGYMHSVAMASPLAMGDMLTIQVFYHGEPSVTGTIFGGVGGINSMNSPSWGTRVTFTQSESYHAREWWPCKQSLHDKIDSVDMWITVPDSLRAGSNGVLTTVTRMDSTHVRYQWRERHPIDYYLISAAVAPYIDHSYYMHFTGSSDSMLVQNYIYPNPLTLLFFRPQIDSTGMIVDYFSGLYSRYPFWDEKYGHCMAPLSGGMEHQTMTTIGFFDISIVAHELSHQWFGDNVTCSTWADICMNEGFASYSEDIFREHFHSHTDMINDIMSKQADVRKYDTGTIYGDDTTSEPRVFDSRLSYHKGACMLHMLRFVVNSDSTFFHVYKTYQQEHKGKNGTIMDFLSAAQSVLGLSTNGIRLDTFFNQWAYREGFPIYKARWNQSGNDVYVQLNQLTAVPTSVSLFKVPIEIKLHSATGDTVVRVNNDQQGQQYHFTWHKSMTSMVIDPNHWLLDSVASITHDTLLSVLTLPTVKVTIYPNPTSSDWIVDLVPANSELTLTDITGRVLWQTNNVTGKVAVPSNGLAAGMYLLRVRSGDGQAVYRVEKR